MSLLSDSKALLPVVSVSIFADCRFGVIPPVTLWSLVFHAFCLRSIWERVCRMRRNPNENNRKVMNDCRTTALKRKSFVSAAISRGNFQLELPSLHFQPFLRSRVWWNRGRANLPHAMERGAINHSAKLNTASRLNKTAMKSSFCDWPLSVQCSVNLLSLFVGLILMGKCYIL